MASIAGSKGGMSGAIKKECIRLRKEKLEDIKMLNLSIGVELDRWELSDESHGETYHSDGSVTLATKIKIAEASTASGNVRLKMETHAKHDYVCVSLTKSGRIAFCKEYRNCGINTTHNPLYSSYSILLNRIEEYQEQQEKLESTTESCQSLRSELNQIREARKTLGRLLG